MCTSILYENITCSKNVSCFEWCMADPGESRLPEGWKSLSHSQFFSSAGKDCVQVYAEVRQNGTDAIFYDCHNVSWLACQYIPWQSLWQIFNKTCLTINDPPNNRTWKCKDIDNYQCDSLHQVFRVILRYGHWTLLLNLYSSARKASAKTWRLFTIVSRRPQLRRSTAMTGRTALIWRDYFIARWHPGSM